MTDDRTPNDGDDLDERIRVGVRALADEAPQPPDVPVGAGIEAGPVPVQQFGHPLAIVGAVAAVLVLVAGMAILITHTDEPDVVRADTTTTTAESPMETTTTVPDRPLGGTRWLMESATEGGEPLVIPEQTPTVVFEEDFDCPGDAGSCSPPDGSAWFAFDGCNSTSGSMRFEGHRIFPLGNGISTLVGCQGPTFGPFSAGDGGKADATTWDITGDTLVLRGQDGRVLTYRADDRVFPDITDGSTVLLESDDPDAAYRVLWRAVDDEHYTMTIQAGFDGGVSADRPGVGASANDPKVWVKAARTYEGPLLYGLVPANVTRVVYVPSGSDPIEVGLDDLDGGPFRGIAELVPSESGVHQVIAYDAEGNEVEHTTVTAP